MSPAVVAQASAKRADAGAANATVANLCSRRSVSPRRLGLPAPSAGEIRTMIQAAVAVPDHAGLRPWRFVEVPGHARGELADIFVTSRRRRDPAASNEVLARERDKAYKSPTLICVCAQLHPDHPRVPLSEQFASVGAAVQNLLLCAHALGYGGIMLSGERVREPELRDAFRLSEHEQLVGFVSLGTVVVPPRSACRPEPEEVLSTWHGKLSGPAE